ncbi:Na+/H+ antiporter subunit D, partial [Staphylococcus caprae]
EYNPKLSYRGLLTVAIVAVVCTVVFALSADVLYPVVKEAASSFYDPSVYIDSVLGDK